MGLGPVGSSLKVAAMTCAESNDLLLCLLQQFLSIIPHADIFFHSIVLVRRDIDLAICAIGQALGYLFGIPLIRLYGIFAAARHGGRGQNDAFRFKTLPIMLHNLMIERVAQAAGLIAAYEMAAAAKLRV